ncbi:MAG: hypothetical protein U9N54_11885 [candidate division Zixibacteria bacterium]|nr:hypothetical protein [candidate division Zixibacteria bacterium]
MKKIILILFLISVMFAQGITDGKRTMQNYFIDFIADSTLGTSNYGISTGQRLFQNEFIDFLEWADTTARDSCGTIKIHRIVTHDTITANSWTDCSGMTQFDSETQGGVAELNADGKTIDILKDGFYQFGGCLHTMYPGAGIWGSPVTILSRLFLNDSTELRCSQRGFNVSVSQDEEGIISYNGTVGLSVGDAINLQYYTNNGNIEFWSNSNFENRIAYTLWLIRCGN